MRILIAEDARASRLIVQDALETLGHDCLAAHDGDQAWRLYSESEVDVVISDWMMPGIDGDELCRKIRAASTGRYPYFIMLTSRQDREDIVAAMEAGVDDYLHKPFDHDELRSRLIAAERVTTLHTRLARQQAELERLNAALHDDARRDHLTGVGNRLRMDEDLETLVEAAQRYGHQFSVALFDVDRFKAFNDEHGHLAGDEVLRAVAAVLAGKTRRGDAVYRYGGEELLVTLLEQDLGDAKVAAERMRLAVGALQVSVPGSGQVKSVTVSAGVAQFEPADTGDRFRLLARADEALYRAKQLGRNRVVVSELGAAAADCQEKPADAPSTDDRPILLVEDDVTQARMIEGMLRMTLAGREVVHVETLGEAKRYLRAARVSCILLDMMLPDSSGLGGLVDVRNAAPEAPVVVVTADGDESRAVKAVQAGAQDYLIKDRMDGAQLCRSVLYAIERQRGELLLAHQALHDEMTGLPNRTLFVDRLLHELAQSERRSTSVAVLFLDLDGFKAINDRLGHAAGDRLLRVLAGRLLCTMRPGDTVARYGGDEFTVLGAEIQSADDARVIAERVAGTVTAPLTIDGDRVQLSCSIGVALADGFGRKAQDVIRAADEAMYLAKRRGQTVSFAASGVAQLSAG